MSNDAHALEDLSAYMIAGRVRATPDSRSETAGRTPAQGIQDGVEAERIGFRRVFLSERWNLKESAVLLGAVGSLTTRIGLGTGLISAPARNPLHAAAFGSTMQAAFGPRFVMGVGRGDRYNLELCGLRHYTFAALRDHVSIIRRLWRGETVSYDGPAGRLPAAGDGRSARGSGSARSGTGHSGCRRPLRSVRRRWTACCWYPT